ncbi:MAG: hypothetical protein E7172_03995 [Firmicutes bacterium]|nr:hypothetical protein [Bacillota bacterium]
MDNKKVIEYCKNFYKIVNFEPLFNDGISDKLIRIYQGFIFNIDLNNDEDIKTIQELDHAVGKYIDDYSFRKEFQKQIVKVKIKRDAKDMLKEFIKSIINIFNDYEEYTTRVIYISRWI